MSIVTRANFRGEVVSGVLPANFELSDQASRERDTYTAIQFVGAQDVAKPERFEDDTDILADALR